MVTNDFLAQGGDGYTMLSGSREEGPSLNQAVMDTIENNYADPLPQTQIIQMTAVDYADFFTNETSEEGIIENNNASNVKGGIKEIIKEENVTPDHTNNSGQLKQTEKKGSTNASDVDSPAD